MANSPSEFIDEIGAREVAKAVDRDIGVVRVWKYRNEFPPSVWLHLNKAFPQLTLERLTAFQRAKQDAA